MNSDSTSPPQTTIGPSGPDLQELLARRSNQLREQEWEMAQKLLALASTLITRLRLKTDCAPPSQLHALLELASRLGRLACAPPADSLDSSYANFSHMPAFEESLRKIYGPAASQNPDSLPWDPPTSDSQPPVAPGLGASLPTPSSQ